MELIPEFLDLGKIQEEKKGAYYLNNRSAPVFDLTAFLTWETFIRDTAHSRQSHRHRIFGDCGLHHFETPPGSRLRCPDLFR